MKKNVSTKQDRIAQTARADPERALVSLHHHIDIHWLAEAYRRTRKDGAPGIDRQSAGDYEKNLMANLGDLLERFKSGKYKAPPVRRAYIPKGNGEMRPLGIPTFEDKVLQRAIVMLLEPIYEESFLDCSYGFRPGRNAHGAIREIRSRIMEMGGCWVLDADIRQYFDRLDHAHLRDILDLRIRDGVVRRIIHKWLKAGVMEDGEVHRKKIGSPQGGVISPLLSNIYLHEVLDTWFEKEIKPRLQGRAYLVRYADDFVMLFEHERDARRVFEVLPKRFEKYGLQIHPEKTRLVRFEPPEGGDGGTFDFLGFTHYWGKSRRGRMVVKRKTARGRLARSLKAISDWCEEHRHWPVEDQWKMLCAKLEGHYQYYGINGNSRSLASVHRRTERIWQKWLSRRTRERGSMNWERFKRLLKRYPLSRPRIRHSFV